MNAFPPTKVTGGFARCDSYNYKYKFGEIDPKSKNPSYTYKYDSKGNMIEEIIEKEIN